MSLERFGHNESQYERPNYPYRCGRAALWGKPCSRGPQFDGTCGGVSECEPYFNGNGYECRRSPAAGGPCAQGPGPDGSCAIQQPPCVPRRPLRRLRGRVTRLVVLVALIALVGFSGTPSSLGPLSLDLRDPGGLSGAHARFAQETGCATCHTAVGDGPLQWLTSSLSAHDMTADCTTCHSFAGPAVSPHNLVLASASESQTLACTACHSEHQGESFDLTAMSDLRCHSCHKKEHQFTSFSKDHPAFGPDYPYEASTAIKFDHKKHFDPPTQVPENCISCHDLSRAGRNVPIKSFDVMCGECHAIDIPKRPLILVTLPEFEQDLLALNESDAAGEAPIPVLDDYGPDELLDACDADFDALARLAARLEADGDEPEDGDDEEYESVSGEEPTAMDAFLLATDPDDLETYWAPYRQLILAMAIDGLDPLTELVDERLGEAASKAVLAGLDSDLVEAVACAWAANEEYESERAVGAGSWFSDGLTLQYKPRGHSDPVLKAWLTRGLALAATPEDDAPEHLSDLIALFLPSKGNGPGACNTCHWLKAEPDVDTADQLDEAPQQAGEVAQVAWRHRGSDNELVQYLHGPHINLLGPGTWCQSCHKLDKSADYEANFGSEGALRYFSNFQPIAIGQCRDCHNDIGVRQTCATCHQYHRGPAFKKRMLDDVPELQAQN